MSRRGVEEKPAWSGVPTAVRAKVEETIGARVIRGERAYGGYGPTPTFRLRCADGSRVFLKATSPDSNEFARHALVREERNYRELAPFIGHWSPSTRGAFRLGGWHALLLDDAGPKSVPPWTPGKARAVARGLAAFHASTLGRELPSWLARPERYLGRLDWSLVEERSDGFQILGELAGEPPDDGRAWLGAAAPVFHERLNRWPDTPERFALLHGDVRSDNLRLHGARLILFDWPHAVVGVPEYDLVEFAQTVAVEGGPEPESVVRWYAEGAEIDPRSLEAAISWWAAFFADAAWRPEIPGLPRLRAFQRRQLGVLLKWATRRFGFPPSPWIERLKS
jgi:hypothetical protein